MLALVSIDEKCQVQKLGSALSGRWGKIADSGAPPLANYPSRMGRLSALSVFQFEAYKRLAQWTW